MRSSLPFIWLTLALLLITLEETGSAVRNPRNVGGHSYYDIEAIVGDEYQKRREYRQATRKFPKYYTPQDLAYIKLSPQARKEYTIKKNEMIEALLLPKKVEGRILDLAAILAGATAAIGTAGTIANIGQQAVGTASTIVNGLISVTNLAREIAKEILALIERHEDHKGFIKGMLYLMDYETESLCNYLVFNFNKNHKNNLDPTGWFSKERYDRQTFGVWAVTGGSFTNKDWLFDASVWGYGGDFTKSGKTVHFSYRPCPDTDEDDDY